jgi:SpoVK/Ycf46/Vps4 family AAA+-type ATPase
MQYICAQVKYRNIVGEEWGFFEKTPYGRGISVLFYGPPGTGKTMAVQVIAAELGLELYRIDLSKMVSKYIGETEKNISALFERAKQMNVILFFDEADSLFAKRSEVKDSNDRNANAETAHLLQKMEEYEGMVILATNLVDQIDDAFRRRIKFMIPFRFPDVETRKKLWHSLIPDKTPLEDGIDLDFFAETFELSGSQIKEILWNAAYIAVADQKPLGNEQLKEATMWNYMKYGKQLTKEDFGYLA